MKLESDPALSDNTPVVLNADNREVALGNIRNAIHALGFLNDLVSEDDGADFTVATRKAAVGVAEACVVDIIKATGYDGDLARERDRRYAEIRAANMEIRRLEGLIGSQRPTEGLAQQLSVLSESVHKYWSKLGFTLVYDSPRGSGDRGGGGFFGIYGNAWYEAVLIATVDTSVHTSSDTPASDRESGQRFVEELEKNLDLVPEDYSRGYFNVLDTPRSREYITDKLRERFPSVQVQNWNIQRLRKKGMEDSYEIDSLRIRISDLSDLSPREVPEK